MPHGVLRTVDMFHVFRFKKVLNKKARFVFHKAPFDPGNSLWSEYGGGLLEFQGSGHADLRSDYSYI